MLKFFLSFCKHLYNKISKFSYKINDKLAQFLCKETIFFAEFSKLLHVAIENRKFTLIQAYIYVQKIFISRD